MKFKVSKKVKGSLILKSIGRPVSAGTVVYVEGSNLYADDIKGAVKSGLLICDEPEIKNKVKENIMDRTAEAVIINKTDRVVIVGNVPIRPNASAIRKIDTLDMGVLRKSIETGLIQVITDVDTGIFDDLDNNIKPKEETVEVPEKEVLEKEVLEKEVPEKESDNSIYILEETSPTDKKDTTLSPEEELAKIIEDAESVNSNEIEEEDSEDESESNTFVWDFRTQEKKKPQIVPKSGQKLIDFDKEDDVEMIDALDEVNDISDSAAEEISNKMENIIKKASQTKTSKKKDQKPITLKINKEDEDVLAPALDSMGRPLQDGMEHMVGGFESEEISFADQEQAKKNIDMAKKTDSSINIDLD